MNLRPLLLVGLLAAAACMRAPAPPVEPASSPAPVAVGDPSGVNDIAVTLQLTARTDPATRADPYPCARAAYYALQNHWALPRCYYMALGW